MNQRFINQFGEHEAIHQVFLVLDKQLRTNRNGNLYLQMRLSDRTGTVNAMMWNVSDRIMREFATGDYVRATGNTQYYNGAMQIIVTNVERVAAETVNEEDFNQLKTRDVEKLLGEFTDLLRQIGNHHLRGLAECFLIDHDFLDRFSRAPAAVKNHHAYPGGLVEHVVTLMHLTQSVARHYPQIDADELLMGAMLHDLGKIEELAYDRELTYTDEGQLIGHVVIGVRILEDKLKQTVELMGEPFPPELALRLKHLVVSHHGQYEYGSPRLPMTTEAMVLHLLDNLDAKVNSFDQLMRDDANTSSLWTPYQASLGRKLFKRQPQLDDASAANDHPDPVAMKL